MDSDKLMCMWAGIIEVSDAGQSKCATGAKTVDIEVDEYGGFGKLLDINFSL
jgi:hypothetical protein